MGIAHLMSGQRSSCDQPFLKYETGVFWAVFGVFTENAPAPATLPTRFVIRTIKLTRKSLSH